MLRFEGDFLFCWTAIYLPLESQSFALISALNSLAARERNQPNSWCALAHLTQSLVRVSAPKSLFGAR
jgi:hypothetical protein